MRGLTSVGSLALSFGALLLTSFVLSAAPANAQTQNKAQQKCIVEMNKGVAKVAKAQGKDIRKCIKAGAKGRLVGQSIEQCTTADNKRKVAKAAAKLKAKLANKCPTDPNSPDAPDFVAETPPDPNFHIQAAIAAELSLIHGIFGSDLDASIVIINKASDKELGTFTKLTSKCQIDVAKGAKKCFDAKWKVFIKCKKAGLRGKLPPARKVFPGLIDSASDLETHCLQDPNEDTGQPDPKGKIAKRCGKLGSTSDKGSCAFGGVDLDLAFPLRDPGSGFLSGFVFPIIECEFCRLVNTVDGLERDCDLFDDGLANGSCGGGCVAFGGVEVGGACWFLGAEAADCDATCASVGLSYDDATRTYAGSDGSLANCYEVLDALGNASAPAGDISCGSVGAGCSISVGSRIRCISPVTDPTSSNGELVRACACE